ncbi:MAG: hypothetical protein EWV45_09795 [Microcystis flos-aquae Mf_QC_C_20070823_S10D]|uniref:Uncharacterized protein n=1 Tax=Microcystis flos-aquae Mf_QC_C_20070823_S10D TaxID=2486236 RepID=A0A552KWM4_9CHRO|nr:MAG: hypothetical protein EWV65_08830 [Microcystis flos-aquae Ma_QC_C_20070823_S18D]TRV12285.1 MAG: hypothetical protein EWV45_09795 [Microcystis flos-aquae Mf_QC_C_20070823_S10D]TRV26277.1 MAG: hypothetical protein EWV72_07400 [Microcystis flos-aquae Mf_QC_C_20070823_S10]TRV34508.1 MAG: hypothetical protein EWV71_14455 [Microcystis flos-aquae Mf_QC_C_20070823_S20D]TRV34555.1 MAG: hypothetical protein EWV44_16015 [Microcystis flos-aquae Mf_QC_C_20070823_S20T]TRV36450.1 MAG: hypothetical pro
MLPLYSRVNFQQSLSYCGLGRVITRVCGKKFFGGGRVWGFRDFEWVNYLIFREKVPEFSTRSLPDLVLFGNQKV